MWHLTYSTLSVLFSIVIANIIYNVKDNIISHYDTQWNQWKYTQNRNYGSVEEEKARKEIFIDNLMYIEAFNKEKHSFTLGVNKFADNDYSEYRETILTNVRDEELDTNEDWKVPNIGNITSGSIDWRIKGAVGAVKDQGKCACGWAFSAVGSLEGQHAIKTGEFVALSEQQLLECTGTGNCKYGSVHSAYMYWTHGREESERAYPYASAEGYTGFCKFNASRVVVERIKGFRTIDRGHCDDILYSLHTIGPISAALDASQRSFQFYHDGIYNEHQCNSLKPNHAVLIIAYYATEDYYWVKNSYGTSWGIGGNFKIKAFSNVCGFCQQASYPILK